MSRKNDHAPPTLWGDQTFVVHRVDQLFPERPFMKSQLATTILVPMAYHLASNMTTLARMSGHDGHHTLFQVHLTECIHQLV